MPSLPRNCTLQDLQEYVESVERTRGFDSQSSVQKCLLLGEEIGELFKAVRRRSEIGVDPSSTEYSVGEELADVLNFVIAIANRFQIDLESAYRDKEERNSRREWR